MEELKFRSFGSTIRARRRELELTQEELARRLGTSVPYIGHLESERRHPSEKTIKGLAEVLGMDPCKLFFLANPGTKQLLSMHSEARSVWESFRDDESYRKVYNITDEEMRVLSEIALLGEARSPRDFIFILNTIRHALG